MQIFRPINIYLHRRFEEASGLKGAEIGVLSGDNAFEIASLLGDRLSRLYLVDPYIPYDENSISNRDELNYRYGPFMQKQKEKARRKLEPYSFVNFVYEPSVEAAGRLLAEGELLDFVYIDATHTEEEVRKDITAWLPLVKPGGVLSGHDFNFKGVSAAVRALLEPYELLPGGTDWVYIKPEKEK